MADVSLCALGDTHLKVDAVADDVHLDRVVVIEQVTIVPIVVANGVLVFREAFLQLLLVVHVTLLHTERAVQPVGGHDGVTHPRDVTQEIALTLIDLYIDIDVLIVDGPHGVFQDGGIAVAQFVVLVDKCRLGFIVTLRSKLLRLEDVAELAGLVDFSEGTFFDKVTLNLVLRQVLQSVEDYLAHLHLRLLVDGDVEDDLVLARHVVTLHNLHVGVLIAFVVEVLLGQDFRTVNHVWGNLISLHDAQLGLHVLTLRLLQPVVVDAADAGTGGQMDAEIHLGANDGVGADRHS